MRNSLIFGLCGLLTVPALCGAVRADAAGTVENGGLMISNSAPPKPARSSVYQFQEKSLEGAPVDLSKYKGQVLLIVNVASKCGFTPQYKALEELYKKYSGQGLQILGFPANQFAHQEPGTDAQIKEFCTQTYGVSFPMFSKVVVKGDGQTPLFHYLTQEANPALTGDIAWNFEKFLISRDGKLVARFKSAVKPDSTQLVSAVETELAKK